MKAEDFRMEAREDTAKSYYLPLHPTCFEEFVEDQARRIEGIDRVPQSIPIGKICFWPGRYHWSGCHVRYKRNQGSIVRGKTTQLVDGKHECVAG